MNQEIKGHLRLGGIFSLLFGVFGSIYSVCLVLFLLSDLLPLWSIKFFSQAVYNQTLLLSLFWSSLLLNVVVLGIIISFKSLVRAKNAALVNWISVVAIIGVGTSLYQNSVIVKNLTPLLRSFSNFPAELQHAVSLIKMFEGDHFILYWLSLGLWFSTISFFAKDNNVVPKLLVFLGYIIGVSAITNSLSVILQSDLLFVFSLFTLAIVLPIWGFREGFFLRSMYQRETLYNAEKETQNEENAVKELYDNEAAAVSHQEEEQEDHEIVDEFVNEVQEVASQVMQEEEDPTNNAADTSSDEDQNQ